MKRIVFWENIVSQHKLAYWEYLAKSNQVSEFVLVVEQALSSQLKTQGWQSEVPELPKFVLIVNPSNQSINDLLLKDIPNSFHVFSGIKAIPMVYKAFQLSTNYNLNRILLTESVNINGVRSVVRRLASVFIERKFLKHYDIVLGSGANTKSWYIECGVKAKNFYSFLYSISGIETVKKKSDPTINLRFLFIGQLIERKGLDILLNALSGVKTSKWTLDIYGTGEQEKTIINTISTLGLNENVKLHGVLTNNELRKTIGFHDVLILPSRFDGWGAVVNEAITSGLKVICSDRCGASILMINQKIGYVFDINKPKSLTKLLEQSISEKEQIDKEYILNYGNYLKGEKVGQYLIDIIDFHYNNKGIKPLPPWEKFQLEEKSIVNHQNSED